MTNEAKPRRLHPILTGTIAVIAIALMWIQLHHMLLVRNADRAAELGDEAGCRAIVADCEAWLDGGGRLLRSFDRDCDVDCAP